MKILYLTLGKRHYPFTFNEYETIESLFFNDFNRDKKNSFIKSNSKCILKNLHKSSVW
ncbi:hypothetical protein LEP1GSC049_4090 [Leptospira kirschneri serovar Cynopteri str. 3522 CT]|nr:hypothetical protein LEP1GSC064_3286 [Leptospira kirschneri serovar Grippotyphosa str. Moskva]EPG48639.1 hypothetical protein LEP1GSC049_4090 [Leptospira kirschneri serovar Cynopteri str. 3522 CT]